MLIGYIKSGINTLRYRFRYPTAKIASGAFITRDTRIGTNAVIGAKTAVVDSVVGNEVTIHHECNIAMSELGSHVVIYQKSSVASSILGRYTYIAEKSSVSFSRIGSFCSIGPDIISGYGEHPADFASTSPVFYSILKQCGSSFVDTNYYQERKQIEIGHDVWIGARVFIRDGVKIGNGVIIGAGAIVISDVPDYAIIGGVPARVLRYRFSEKDRADLLRLQWWNWPENKLRTAQQYIISDDISKFIKWADEGA